MRQSIAFLSGVFIVLMVILLPAARAEEKLVMGVHPYRPVTELNKIFKPIADSISQALGIPVELRIAKNHSEAVDLVGKGDADFSFLGPSLYIEAMSKYKVKPLAQIMNNGRPSFYGVIVAKQGSDITSIKTLRGRTFAFGDPDSTLTYLIPVYMLKKAGILLSDLKKYSFVGSNENVAESVVSGKFDAGGLQPDVAAKYKDQGLKVISQSMDIPEHVFVASNKLDAVTTAKIGNGLLGLDIKLLKGIKGAVTGIQKFDDRDFDGLRNIIDIVAKIDVKKN